MGLTSHTKDSSAFFRNIPVLLAKRGRLAPRGIFICGADKARFPACDIAAIDGLFSFGDLSLRFARANTASAVFVGGAG